MVVLQSLSFSNIIMPITEWIEPDPKDVVQMLPYPIFRFRISRVTGTDFYRFVNWRLNVVPVVNQLVSSNFCNDRSGTNDWIGSVGFAFNFYW